MDQAFNPYSAMPSTALLRLIQDKNQRAQSSTNTDPLSSIGGSLAFHCSVDLNSRQVLETASMASLFRGYESLLPGRDLNKVGLVSSTASGICGGVHATASALCLEMAMGLKPPALGIILRNLLLSCQYLNDNTMHLFVLAGPDYSAQRIAAANPEIWQQAQQKTCRYSPQHHYHTVSDILTDLNKPSGKLYKKALTMVGVARRAYTILGGKYPHSESVIPGGVSLSLDHEKLTQFRQIIEPFVQFAEQSVAIWDEVFEFLLEAEPRYQDLGRCDANMLDFGQWDHEDYYDGSYQHCDNWGNKRWSTPGVIIDGKLQTTRLSELNAGMEEFVDYSYFADWSDDPANFLITHDPLGNSLSPHHPWNKRRLVGEQSNNQAYSWGSALTWRGHSFEVGAYARLYLTACAQKVADSDYLAATGNSLDFSLPMKDRRLQLSWKIPLIWNAFERNRARAYVLGFNLAAIFENTDRAERLIATGDTAVAVPMRELTEERHLGVGLWGASRGFLAHWARLEGGKIENYQISIPSRVNASTRTPNGGLGPCEEAVLNTPIIETNFRDEQDFQGIDIQRAIQSFDPCMSCTTHIRIDGTDTVLDAVVDTGFPI